MYCKNIETTCMKAIVVNLVIVVTYMNAILVIISQPIDTAYMNAILVIISQPSYY